MDLNQVVTFSSMVPTSFRKEAEQDSTHETNKAAILKVKIWNEGVNKWKPMVIYRMIRKQEWDAQK